MLGLTGTILLLHKYSNLLLERFVKSFEGIFFKFIIWSIKVFKILKEILSDVSNVIDIAL